MQTIRTINEEQTALWNGLAGRGWVEAQETLDRMFKPLEDLLAGAVAAASASRVLDIGCGTGSTTLALARLTGAAGESVGIDISEPMLATARARAEREGAAARFVRADAQTHAFEPASFDMLVSRFGVMFFDDPVRAFANLRSAARTDARLLFIAWRSGAENPFMTAAERAATPLLPNLPATQPDAPGPLAFADRSRVERILQESGWSGIEIAPIDVPCALPEKDLAGYLARIGPIARVLHNADPRTRAEVMQTVRAAFDPFVFGDEVRFTAACWLIGARAASWSEGR